MNPRSFLLVLCFGLLSGCATLTPQAARLMTIRDGAVMAMMDCQELGYVTGNAGIWGGSAGLDAALTNAKNKAAEIPRANAILVTSSRMNPTSVVNATVFNCSERKTQKIEVVNPQPVVPQQQPQVMQETIRRARACQERGGVWLNDQCVIDIQ